MFLPFTLLIKVLNNNKSQEKLGVQALEETLEPVTEPLPSEKQVSVAPMIWLCES